MRRAPQQPLALRCHRSLIGFATRRLARRCNTAGSIGSLHLGKHRHPLVLKAPKVRQQQVHHDEGRPDPQNFWFDATCQDRWPPVRLEHFAYRSVVRSSVMSTTSQGSTLLREPRGHVVHVFTGAYAGRTARRRAAGYPIDKENDLAGFARWVDHFAPRSWTPAKGAIQPSAGLTLCTRATPVCAAPIL